MSIDLRARKLLAENAKMRTALKSIAAPFEGVAIGDPWAFYADLQRVAQDALDGLSKND